MPQELVQAEEAIAQIAAGRIVVVIDEEGREGAGDLVVAAEAASSEVVNFMAHHGRGFISLAMTPERCDELELPLLPRRGAAQHELAFTSSIEAREGVTTGISAADRARTIAVAADPAHAAADIVRPGHV
nr:3,4-dihydroxy-2-butanone-4-phosphate synthase [Solirubrobacterales bacterium]